MHAQPLPIPQHSLLEDMLAILIGALLVSFGMAMFKQVGLLTGSTAGLAYLWHYVTGQSFGGAFFVINLPFYYLAVQRKGWAFTVKTFCAVGLVALFSDLHGHLAHFGALNALYTGLIGGLLMGVGLIVLFRHQASLGGVNILALWLQDTRGIRAGKLQMAIDLTILSASVLVVSPWALACSVLGAVLMNLVIAMNHRPGRYLAV
ncbi:MAG: YitT family protein [Paludibacterium sp.]|uniref:YitT family protein n=1 Tax=Paludibacterium sp. TaxID=1917523 RepID=UPI0025E8B30E|nr:YitT family protein [Paludibacterium sp.]MBV8046432.1 YitT family protein [Paludibacterium sp.]MBV8647896.1 YitT family protein [Paludibacterium sp.]